MKALREQPVNPFCMLTSLTDTNRSSSAHQFSAKSAADAIFVSSCAAVCARNLRLPPALGDNDPALPVLRNDSDAQHRRG